MKQHYTAAIIGCGGIAGIHDRVYAPGTRPKLVSHAAMYADNTRVVLQAAADISRKQLHTFARKWNVPRAYTDHARMLIEIQPDIVSVCTPASTHPEILKLIAASPARAVFCEKPLGCDSREATAAFRKFKNRIFFMNFTRRWDAAVQTLKDELDCGGRGAISSVVFHHSRGIRHNGCHAVDLLLYLFGTPQAIRLLKIHEKIENDFVVDFLCEYQGFNAYVLGNHNLAGNYFGFEIVTQQGVYTTQNNGTRIYWRAFEKSKDFEGYKLLAGRGLQLKSSFFTGMRSALNEIIAHLDADTASCSERYLETFRITDSLYKKALRKN